MSGTCFSERAGQDHFQSTVLAAYLDAGPGDPLGGVNAKRAKNGFLAGPLRREALGHGLLARLQRARRDPWDQGNLRDHRPIVHWNHVDPLGRIRLTADSIRKLNREGALSR